MFDATSHSRIIVFNCKWESAQTGEFTRSILDPNLENLRRTVQQPRPTLTVELVDARTSEFGWKHTSPASNDSNAVLTF